MLSHHAFVIAAALVLTACGGQSAGTTGDSAEDSSYINAVWDRKANT